MGTIGETGVRETATSWPFDATEILASSRRVRGRRGARCALFDFATTRMPREESADLLEWAARSASSAKEATNSTERPRTYSTSMGLRPAYCVPREEIMLLVRGTSGLQVRGGGRKIFRVGTPSMDGVRFYQDSECGLGSVTSSAGNRIAICEIRRMSRVSVTGIYGPSFPRWTW